MRVLELFHNLYVVELDVEKLVDGFESAADGDVILKLDGDFVVNESLEETRREWSAYISPQLKSCCKLEIREI